MFLSTASCRERYGSGVIVVFSEQKRLRGLPDASSGDQESWPSDPRAVALSDRAVAAASGFWNVF